MPQRGQGLLLRLGRKPVHEIRVHHDSRVAEGREGRMGRGERDALVHQLQQAVHGAFEPARDGDAARADHEPRQLRRECRVEPHVPPPAAFELPSKDLPAHPLDQSRRHRLVREVKPILPRLAGQCLHGIDDACGLWHLEALDVVKRDVAESAFVPVAASGHLDLEPAPRGP